MNAAIIKQHKLKSTSIVSPSDTLVLKKVNQLETRYEVSIMEQGGNHYWIRSFNNYESAENDFYERVEQNELIHHIKNMSLCMLTQ